LLLERCEAGEAGEDGEEEKDEPSCLEFVIAVGKATAVFVFVGVVLTICGAVFARGMEGGATVFDLVVFGVEEIVMIVFSEECSLFFG